jgi:hypothetical protein
MSSSHPEPPPLLDAEARLRMIAPVFESPDEQRALRSQLDAMARALERLDQFVTEAGGNLPATSFAPLSEEAPP